MTDTTVALRFRERRVQLIVVGGLAMVLALGALAARNERALFVDGSGDPKAFGALAVAPPAVGSLKRFGWVPRDVLARSFAPVRPATLPLAARRRALGGSSIPEEEGFAGPVVPIDALPLTADALGLSGPAPIGGLPGPMYASAGGAVRSGAGGGGAGSGGGSGGGSQPAASTPTPVETPTPSATPTPTETATPAPATEPAATTAPTTDGGVSSPAQGAGTDPTLPIDIAYQPPSQAGPMLQPPPDDWPTAWPDPFETSEPPPSTEVPATTADPVTPVPEPSTWAMLLLGFALVGRAVRGKRTGRAPLRV